MSIAIKFRYYERPVLIKRVNIRLNLGEAIIVETNRGIEFAQVIELCPYIANRKKKSEIVIKKILRRASAKDIAIQEETIKMEQRRFQKTKDIAKKFNLNIKILKADLLFDQKTFIFYYKLLKDKKPSKIHELINYLKKEIQCRIIHKQLSDRLLTKELGGVGVCGQRLCCAKFLDRMPTVSVKFVKEQGLAMNIPKLTGVCGKLKCCLKYEN